MNKSRALTTRLLAGIIAWAAPHRSSCVRFESTKTDVAWILAAMLFSLHGCGFSANSPPQPAPGRSARPINSPVASQDEVGSSAVGMSSLKFAERPLGIDVRYSNGSAAKVNSIVETLGGGVAMFDYDRDGCLDLFATGGGQFTPQRTLEGLPSQLLRGDGVGNFTPVIAGLEASRYFSHGCWAADLNNDGFGDLLVTGYGGLQLFHNQGDGTFLERADAAQLHDPSWSTATAWGDINRDGYLDLYVAHYVDWSFQTHRACNDPQGGQNEICGPKNYSPLNDRMFLSQGDGTFADVTTAVGLVAGGKGLGVVMGDFDLDNDLDLYVANDTTENFLYLNRGDGHFDEVGQPNGVAVDDAGRPTGSMGVDLADFDGDGLPDLWTANYEHEIFGLYRNLGHGQFLHVSRTTGFAAIADQFVGWGTGFADFDRDGDLDVIAATGHVKRFPATTPVKQLPLVWLQDNGRFIKQSFPANTYLGTPHAGRGLALGDLDRDGDMDVVITHNDRPLAILSNETVSTSQWLRIHLTGRQSCRDAIGARLGLKLGNQTVWRQIQGGGSYLSQSELRPYWAIPTGAKIEGLTIHWPSGQTQVVHNLLPNTTMFIIEPD
ncbi:MAG: UnbV [Planctomycetaceae bacterium]|nr:UnbV [Planctomycetaceae bacterium]